WAEASNFLDFPPTGRQVCLLFVSRQKVSASYLPVNDDVALISYLANEVPTTTARARNVDRYTFSIEGTTPTGSNSSHQPQAINIGILRIHEVCITSLVRKEASIQCLCEMTLWLERIKLLKQTPATNGYI